MILNNLLASAAALLASVNSVVAVPASPDEVLSTNALELRVLDILTVGEVNITLYDSHFDT